MLRLLACVVSVFVGGLLLGFGLLYWRAQDPAIVAAQAIGSTPEPALVEALRADAAAAAMTWWLLVMIAVAICAALFLLGALRRRPRDLAHARGGGLAWWLLLLLAVVLALGAGYVAWSNELVASSWRVAMLIFGTVFVPLAYWLATATGVRNEMAPAVPLATLMR